MLMDIRDMIQVVLDQNLMSPQVQAVMKQYNIPQQTLGNNALVNNFIRNPQSGRILPQSPYYQLTDAQAIQDPEKRQEALNNATMGMVMGMTTPVEPKPTAKSLTALVESARGVQRDSVIVSAQNALDRIHQSPTGVRDYAPVYDFLKNAEAGKDTPDQMRAVQELLALHGEANLSTKLPTQTGEITVYRGGRDMGDSRILTPAKQNSGALFFTESEKYAKQYSKTPDQVSGLYKTNIKTDKIFDITNPQHIKQLEKHIQPEALQSMKDATNHGAVDWATASQYVDEIEKAGFKGAKFLERPAENITHLPDGSFKLEGNPVYSYALFDKQVPMTRASLPTQVEGLAKEASKYKSAEEFVKAQINAYHGTNKSFDKFELTEGKRTGGMGAERTVKNNAIFLSNDRNVADFFGKNRSEVQGGYNRVIEAKIPQDKILDLNKLPSDVKRKAIDLVERWTGDKHKSIPADLRSWLVDQSEFVDLVKSKGFKGVRFNEGSVLKGDRYTLKTQGGNYTTAIFDPKDILTKSQLTDIFNQSKGVQNKGGAK